MYKLRISCSIFEFCRNRLRSSIRFRVQRTSQNFQLHENTNQTQTWRNSANFTGFILVGKQDNLINTQVRNYLEISTEFSHTQSLFTEIDFFFTNIKCTKSTTLLEFNFLLYLFVVCKVIDLKSYYISTDNDISIVILLLLDQPGVYTDGINWSFSRCL